MAHPAQDVSVRIGSDTANEGSALAINHRCTLNEQDQLTIVMVTHDTAIARQAHWIVRLVEGRLTGEKSAKLQAAN